MPDTCIMSTCENCVGRLVYPCHVRIVHIEIRWAKEYETTIVHNHLPFEILLEKGEDSNPYIQVNPADVPCLAG